MHGRADAREGIGVIAFVQNADAARSDPCVDIFLPVIDKDMVRTGKQVLSCARQMIKSSKPQCPHCFSTQAALP